MICRKLGFEKVVGNNMEIAPRSVLKCWRLTRERCIYINEETGYVYVWRIALTCFKNQRNVKKRRKFFTYWSVISYMHVNCRIRSVSSVNFSIILPAYCFLLTNLINKTISVHVVARWYPRRVRDKWQNRVDSRKYSTFRNSFSVVDFPLATNRRSVVPFRFLFRNKLRRFSDNNIEMSSAFSRI